MGLSVKQAKLFDTWADDHKIILPHGAVRSGKTYGASAAFITHTLQFEGKDFIVAAPGQIQIYRAILKTFDDLGMPYKRVKDGYEIPSKGKPNKLMTFPIQRPDSVNRLGGPTAQGALIDETTDCYQESVLKIIERCSLPGSKIWMVTNPDTATHWYKTDFIDNPELNSVDFSFDLDDNPTLWDEEGEEYKAMLRATLKGVMLRRRYYGEWVSGVMNVYPTIERRIESYNRTRLERFDISIDHANSSVTHALLWAWHPLHDRVHVVDEWRYDPNEHGEILSWEEQTAEILRHFKPWIRRAGISNWVVDVAPAGFKTSIERYISRPEFEGRCGIVHNAHKIKVTEGIDLVKLLELEQKFSIDPRCEDFIKGMINYQWDEKAAEKGEDKPLKEDDHGPDSARYYLVHLAWGERRNSWAALY